MAITVTPLKRKKGLVFRAQVKLWTGDRVAHSVSKTFDKRSTAYAWAETEEERLKAQLDPATLSLSRARLRDLIKRYLDEFTGGAGRTKRKDIEYLQKTALADYPIDKLTSQVYVDHIRARRKTVAASTVNNDLAWLRNILKVARALWKVPVNLDEFEAAVIICRKYKLVGRPKQRDRRPTASELRRLSHYFASRDNRAEIPMLDMMWFAIHSSRRQSEITRLKWADNDDEHKTGMVRDLKHPRKKEGNHRRFKYTARAWAIVQRQPRGNEFIFPYNAKSVGAAFTRACKVLEIEDLRWHDLRHEATSRLFEHPRRYSIPEVQLFTLHEDWSILRKYTNLRPEDLK